MLATKDVQDLRCIDGIGSIVKSENQLLLIVGAVFLSYPLGWQAVIMLFTDEHFAGVHFRSDATANWPANNVQHFTLTGVVNRFIISQRFDIAECSEIKFA